MTIKIGFVMKDRARWSGVNLRSLAESILFSAAGKMRWISLTSLQSIDVGKYSFFINFHGVTMRELQLNAVASFIAQEFFLLIETLGISEQCEINGIEDTSHSSDTVIDLGFLASAAVMVNEVKAAVKITPSGSSTSSHSLISYATEATVVNETKAKINTTPSVSGSSTSSHSLASHITEISITTAEEFEIEKNKACEFNKTGVNHIRLKKYNDAIINVLAAAQILEVLLKVSNQKNWCKSAEAIEKLLGITYSNIGSTYRELNEIGSAICFYEKSMTIKVKLFGEQHLDTLKVKEKLKLLKSKMLDCEIKAVGGEEKPTATSPKAYRRNDMLLHQFSFLDVKTACIAKRVNNEWNSISSEAIWRNLGFISKAEFDTFLNRFPASLHIAIIKNLTPNRINKLNTILSTTKPHDLLSVVAMELQIITAQQAKLFYHSGSSSGPHDVLRYLLVPNGIKALQNRWITPEQACYMPRETLQALFSPVGMKALEDKDITAEQARLFYHSGSCTGPHDVLSYLLVPNGIKALQNRWITPEQACYMPRGTLQALFSPVGMKALEDKDITAEQARLFYHSGSMQGPSEVLNYLMTPQGIFALKNKLVTVEQFCKIPPWECGNYLSKLSNLSVTKNDGSEEGLVTMRAHRM
jgi:hypothetical protein